jgi:TPP-dependent pyruvate/acetoin dehydrogenase alpha subunit
LTEMAPHENPLVPNKKLRQMYKAMAEARLLDEHIAGLQRGVKARKRLASTYGQEACRISTAIELGPGDLVSDAQVGVAMDLLLGAEVEAVLVKLNGLVSKDEVARKSIGERQLPWVEDVIDRLKIAMGAALAAKAQKRKNIVVAYVRHREASGKQWRQVLTLAAKLELPIIFVVLPQGENKKGDGAANLHTKSQVWGVPGMPVDASDAVALYRVSQESIGRTRGGGGPVLIECISYQLKGERGDTGADPMLQMKDFLLGRKVCDEAWLDRAGAALQTRLEATKKSKSRHG